MVLDPRRGGALVAVWRGLRGGLSIGRNSGIVIGRDNHGTVTNTGGQSPPGPDRVAWTIAALTLLVTVAQLALALRAAP